MIRDDNNHTPLHHQLTTRLREMITAGHWGIGDLFPTDKELMAQYQMSSTTVRRALSQLVLEGWLQRRARKGTFVVKERVEETLGRLTGFFEEMASRGYTPTADILTIQVLDVTANLLIKVPGLEELKADRLVFVEKLHRINGQPIVYLKSYWPYEYGKVFLGKDLTSRAQYEIVRTELGLEFTKAEEVIAAASASAKEAQLLEVKRGAPVLSMTRLAFAAGRPIELSINSYRADKYRYRVILLPDECNTERLIFPE
ncbi:MAG: GntR family transcriptional regulator [Negativicutes bacterium]|nr:GntR family transcriptional regulator [Negativicutes bacterium]